MEYISKKVAAYGQFVLVLLLPAKLNYVLTYVSLLYSLPESFFQIIHCTLQSNKIVLIILCGRYIYLRIIVSVFLIKIKIVP